MTVDGTALFLALGLVLAVAQLGGALARRLDQPPVVGELLGGLLLGPTLFGGAHTRTLFPEEIRPILVGLADVGVMLFMFLVGLEFDRRVVRGKAGTLAALSTGSLLLPFLGGSVLAVVIARDGTGVTGVRAAFLGLAMAVTAFPVLARIVVDRGMSGTRTGGLALAVAAIGDLVAWLALAVLVALAGTESQPWRLALLVPFAAVLGGVVPRLLRALSSGRIGAWPFTVLVIAGALGAGAATEWMGLHLIFGAFAFGLVVPRDAAPPLRHELDATVPRVAALFLPVYFVVAGFGVDLSELGTTGMVELAAVLAVAVLGKFAGVYGAARLTRFGRRESATLATLLNVRGLTEIVLLTVGLQAGLVDQRLYSAMVVMALVTTALSGPLLSRLAPSVTTPSRPPSPVGDPEGAARRGE